MRCTSKPLVCWCLGGYGNNIRWRQGFASNNKPLSIPALKLVLGVVPLLLTVSLIEKVRIQEPQLVEVFGPPYDVYRKQVPLFVPWGVIFPSRRYNPDAAPSSEE